MKSMLFVFGLAALGGCSSAHGPAASYGRTQETIATAEATPSARSDVRAAQHLEQAKTQLAEAKRLLNDGKSRAAEWVLRRAEADAEAALALAQARSAEVDAQTTVDRIKQELETATRQGRGS